MSATQEKLMPRPPAIAVSPLTDLVETDEGLVVYCNLPGAEAEGVEVSVEDTLLRVRAVAELAPLSGKVHALEISDVVYEARLELNAAVDPRRARAVLRHGVLEVVLPFLPTGPFRIPVTRD